jgi:spermidine synthase
MRSDSLSNYVSLLVPLFALAFLPFALMHYVSPVPDIWWLGALLAVSVGAFYGLRVPIEMFKEHWGYFPYLLSPLIVAFSLQLIPDIASRFMVLIAASFLAYIGVLLVRIQWIVPDAIHKITLYVAVIVSAVLLVILARVLGVKSEQLFLVALFLLSMWVLVGPAVGQSVSSMDLTGPNSNVSFVQMDIWQRLGRYKEWWQYLRQSHDWRVHCSFAVLCIAAILAWRQAYEIFFSRIAFIYIVVYALVATLVCLQNRFDNKRLFCLYGAFVVGGFLPLGSKIESSFTQSTLLSMHSSTALLFAIASILLMLRTNVLLRKKTEHGYVRVIEDGELKKRLLLIDGIIHGAQYVDINSQSEPISYYGPSSPIMQCWKIWQKSHPSLTVSMIGLGIGTMTSYLRANDHMVIYEINSHIIDIARNEDLFTYLRDTKGQYDVIIGDARQSVHKAFEDGKKFDVLIYDAYNQAIPKHLLSYEAIHLYASCLNPGGMLCINITVSEFNELRDRIAATASILGLFGVCAEYDPANDFNNVKKTKHSQEERGKWQQVGLFRIPYQSESDSSVDHESLFNWQSLVRKKIQEWGRHSYRQLMPSFTNGEDDKAELSSLWVLLAHDQMILEPFISLGWKPLYASYQHVPWYDQDIGYKR